MLCDSEDKYVHISVADCLGLTVSMYITEVSIIQRVVIERLHCTLCTL